MTLPSTDAPTERIPLPHGGGGDPGRPARTRAGAGAGATPRAASRWWVLVVFAIALVAFAVHDPGRLTFDTKLGVNIDPAGFYRRLLDLWNPLEWFGGLQDQYIGYVFPMGAFSLLGKVIGLPVWLVERLWMALLVTAGFWGLVRLAERLRIGGPRSRLVAGAVFALWPTYTILIGSTSAAVVPGLLAPWAVLALTKGTPRVAAARSGLVVLAMGGVNAVSTIAALGLPALFLLTRPPGPRRRKLLLYWPIAVLLASSWWLIPLFFQKAYGFNFLPYIEQAANTTQTMSAASVLRGSGNWVAYLHFGDAWLSAGWAVVTQPFLVGAAAVAAALGLYGLARRDLPESRWLRASAGVAALFLLAGYGGPMGGLFHGTVQHLLDGGLAPFRNVYKFEPALAGVFALGVAHALGGRSTAPQGIPTVHSGRFGVRLARFGGVVAVAAMLAGLALPYATGQILQPGPFEKVPDYWSQAADFLKQHSPTEPAFVTPADSHGTYTWGTPVDDPLEPLAKSPWVQRDQVPFSGAGAQSLLAAAESAVESGAAVPGLAEFLGRAGIKYVVVRNDLDPRQIGYTPPQLVHRTLESSGFTQVTSFGPQLTGGQIYPGTPLAAQALMYGYPAVEIYQATQAPRSAFGPVTALPAKSAVGVTGDPGSLLRLAEDGIDSDRPVIAAGDSTTGTEPSTRVVTDGDRRADNAFGLTQNNASYTYTADGTNPPDDPHGNGGGAPRQLPAVDPAHNQTVAELTGAADVTASSAGSWLWELPQYDPVNVFDGDPRTAWVEGRPDDGKGQWVQLTFDHPVVIPDDAPIQLLDDSRYRPMITKVTATTDAGSADTTLTPNGDVQQLRLRGGRTTSLRITIDDTTPGVPGGLGAGIRGVDLPGVHVTRYLRPASDSGTGQADSVGYRFHRDTASPLTLPAGQPEPGLARTFTTSTPLDLTVRATGAAVPGPALNTAVDTARGKRPGLSVTADSTWGSLPQFRPENLVDGDFRTGWLAAGPDPRLTVSWSGVRDVGELDLLPIEGLASKPTEIHLSSPDGDRELPVPPDGNVKFPPLHTDRLTISFPSTTDAATFNPVLGAPQQLPIGFAELFLPDLKDLRVPPPSPDTRLDQPCGQGPPLVVDGHSYPTSVKASYGDLTDFRPLTVSLCTPGGVLHLDPGKHYLSSPGADGPVAITDLALRNAPPPEVASARQVTVRDWGAEHRTVRIAPGDTSYLEVHEALNPGWTATLDGKPLQSVRLDGWQQGFVVPQGDGGVVTLNFTPGGTYRAALAGSAAGVGVLVVAALLPTLSRRRSRHSGQPAVDREPARWRQVAAVVAVTGLLVVVGGPVAVVVPVLVGLALVRPRWLPWVAGSAMLAAGAISVYGVLRYGVSPGFGAFGGPAQVLALSALAAALLPTLTGPDGLPWRSWFRRQSDDGVT